MKSYHTFTAGGQEYKMRLTASAIMAIEKRLGKSMLAALENIEENMVETLITTLWGAMQPYNENFSFENALDLFDEYIAEGNSVEALMQEIGELFKTAGFFEKGQD